jgi:hypothetical protein
MPPVPAPPAGVILTDPHRLWPTCGERARWQIGDQLPALTFSFRAAGSFGGMPEQPAYVRLSAMPVFRPWGITDPAELRRLAWAALAAATWLERQQPPLDPAPNPQTSIYDMEGV